MKTTFKPSFGYKLIYILEIRTDTHKGLLKIGDATVRTDESVDNLPPNCRVLNQAAKERIKSYTNTAGLSTELLHTELAVRTVMGDDGKPAIKAFRDYDVHRVLENSGISKRQLKNSTSKEWFEVGLQTVLKAITAVKNNHRNLSNSSSDTFVPVIFRDEQEDAINRTLKQFKSGNRMLWNAKMRFGKTLCALEVARQARFKKTIIITHRPVVDKGWYEDFGKIFGNNNNYIYGSKNTGYDVDELIKQDKNFVYFASMQDLRGSDAVGGKFDKNDVIFTLNWDFVIVDEAHEGTTTVLGNDVIQSIVKEESGYDTKFLALSGTPFNILNDYSDNIYTWDYVMEQQRKYNRNAETFGDSNPYDELPELRIYTYNLGNLVAHGSSYIELEDKAFNFREFFRVYTGTEQKPIPAGKSIGDFVHEDDVISFLNLITKDDAKSLYPFSNKQYRDYFKHSLWMVPGVKEARALSKLMKKHSVFGSGAFNIVNVAGEGDEEDRSEEALSRVLAAISNAEKTGDYTITLSCGRLTTGVTVREWTAVFMLAGSFSTSAANYLQTIFRVQSPCNINGKIKNCCYVFDFAPDRTLKMVAESVALSTKAGKQSESDKRILGDFLNYCSVISVDGTEMTYYDPNKLLQHLKRAYAERAVQNGFDDNNLYNDELLKLDNIDLEKFKDLKKIVGASKAAPKSKEIDINNQGFTDEEYEEIARIEKKKPSVRTPEEEKKLKEVAEKKKQAANARSILRGISIRMPLLIYGAEIDINDDITMEKLVDIVEDASWDEFMPSGVTKDLFRQFMKYYDAEVFVAAGRKIRNIAYSADELLPTERVKKIAELFSCFKNPDKETVLTPWRVVNMHISDCLGGYNFYDDEHKERIEEPRFVDKGQVTTDTLANKDARILEINSKTGLYPLFVTYSIFRSKCGEYTKDELDEDLQDKLWRETVEQNIFVICKTPMAKSITKRTLVGYKDIAVNAHYFQDLVNMLRNKPEQFKDKVLRPSYWGIKGDKEMKFDAIVGNPPYQVMDGGNKASAVPIYNHFIQQSKNLDPKYLSMIFPSRWYTGGKGLDDFRDEMLNDTRIRELYDFFDATECFPGVDISGGVCYFLWNRDKRGKCKVTTFRDGKKTIAERSLLADGDNIFIRFNEAITIVNKVLSDDYISFADNVSSRKPFGLPTNVNVSDRKKSGDVKIFAYPNNGYIHSSKITRNNHLVNKTKVLLSYIYGERGNFPYLVIGKPFIGKPGTCCSETYLVAWECDSDNEARNVISYMCTKFFRFLVLMHKNTQHATAKVYSLVPVQDFSVSWTDEKLYTKYGLTDEEITFIESMIRPMEINGSGNDKSTAEESEA